jgi:hypothetical protein
MEAFFPKRSPIARGIPQTFRGSKFAFNTRTFSNIGAPLHKIIA